MGAWPTSLEALSVAVLSGMQDVYATLAQYNLQRFCVDDGPLFGHLIDSRNDMVKKIVQSNKT